MSRPLRPSQRAGLLSRVGSAVLAGVVLLGLLAGVPGMLIGGVGWPLPDHVPSLSELRAVATTPMSTAFLLDALACAAWVIWAVFAVDVAACVREAARGSRRPPRGPLRRVAGVLVGALLVTVLGRSALAMPDSPRLCAATAGPSTPAATAPPTTEQPLRIPADTRTGGLERVRPPSEGVHDSLWRIAQRRLGDGDRWPEIWALNRGSTQPGPRVLTDPNLIRPGDLLRLPADHTTPTRDTTTDAAVPPTQPAPPTTPPPPATATPTPTPTPDGAADTAEEGDPSAGVVTWGGEALVGLGLAAAVSALLLRARRRHHARYRPGSLERGDDPPQAPVVYQLRLAHLHAQHDDPPPVLEPVPDDTDTSDTAVVDAHHPAPSNPANPHPARVLAAPGRHVVTDDTTAAAAPALPVDVSIAGPVGERVTSTRIALDLARTHGLGMAGPGGDSALRALLLTLLAPPTGSPPAPTVLIPADDLTRLLGTTTLPEDVLEPLTVVADLDTALSTLESAADHDGGPTVLVASPPVRTAAQARLQHLLDNHASRGVTALLLGPWRPGVTAYVTPNGTISATGPGLGQPLRGTRALRLPPADARDLLTFLARTHPPRGSGRTAEVEDEISPHFISTASAAEGRGELEITAAPTSAAPPPHPEPDAPRPPATSQGEPAGPDAAPLRFTVLGSPALHWRPHPEGAEEDLTGWLSTRPLEVLTYLAVHPDGVSRDRLVDALWPETPPRNPASAIRTVLARLRRTLAEAAGATATNLILAERAHYRLNFALVTVDYRDFAAAVARRRYATTPDERTAATEAVVTGYTGTLADGLDAEWLVPVREAARRDALDAVAALARARVADDPSSTLDLLETARSFDPHNELLYRDIMRLQHTLGRHTAIAGTLTLLRTHLADLDTTPTADTVELAHRLQQQHTGIPTRETTAGRHS
ncbi:MULTISPECIES: BTAD domain-containing putative transcriptional regulator [Prauserella salsuginis group]|uniref:BTAD domain-containing putative transcriptional regulator n=1 Tax=Prauserella salsuginis TaxID=387889 RepID=A0ABW6FZZ0_9PSEU|nr:MULTISPECIES: BTAD domain-containing putative transcriptional regulator [Prauserella salsuginis group]MCR3721129.1 Transcriptional regulatory protein, C terminal [Prauserella flava]MCR3734791.1 Transcriptional regulatory protein, C terminal [Prauserella salsuginis]